MNKIAKYWSSENNKIQCLLCPRKCLITEGQLGFCKTRINIKNQLFSINYAEITSMAEDPIEKKPLYHFYPGSRILSLGSFGCNFNCKHCQNWSISQHKPEKIKRFSIAELIYFVRESGHKLVAFTYNEPLIWYEYVLEASQVLKKMGVKIVLVTNGYINPEPLQELLPYTAAHALDIKWFFPKTAEKLSGVKIVRPVFDYARQIYNSGQHLEIVTNLVHGYNDSEEELTEIARFIARELSPEIPWHVSRSFPCHQLPDLKITSLEDLQKAQLIGRKNGLKIIHMGNI